MLFGWSVVDVIFTTSWVIALMSIPSVLHHRAGNPSAALSWILALFAIPLVAVILWWSMGRTHLRKRRRLKREASSKTSKTLQKTRSQLEAWSAQSSLVSENIFSIHQLPQELNDAVFPATSGNHIEFLSCTKSVHQVWFDIIDSAQSHLHLLFFTWRDDAIGRALRDCLIQKVRQGVAVRVIYDAMGSVSLPNTFFNGLTKAGGNVASFTPLSIFYTPSLNFRNHRKLLIADGNEAYTGGVNVGDEYLTWQDIGLKLVGPAVNQLQEVFIEDWFYCTEEAITEPFYFFNADGASTEADNAFCSVFASGPDQRFNATREMVFLTITQARFRVWIATPYFIPDEALLLALRTAVYRGVDVRILVPKHSDSWLVQWASKTYYHELLQAGVQIYEYQGMLHAKATIIDASGGLIGSANLDSRSFKLNFELNTFVASEPVNEQLANWYTRLLASSDTISANDVKLISYKDRLISSVAHLLSPLL
ncbi:MAG: cardiolipin synthase [Flavobacteriaceae bacterium TMED42]|nr:MAG: cardiolipin synthase [Flavobacteriaceae bacterium TMED42]|tara:strand:+ start:2359 stop:3798 length:1440 start_codon:yes stop_codon:yes gene_type:complete